MRARRALGTLLAVLAVGAGAALLARPARAAIPEPDHVFYGVVTSDGAVLSNATVSLRRGSFQCVAQPSQACAVDADCAGGDRCDATELASATPGALEGAPDFYVLGVAVEQPSAPGEPTTPGVARAGDMGRLTVTFTDGTGAVRTVPVTKVYVGGRGLAVRVDLEVSAAAAGTGDSDGDGVSDFADNCGGVANPAQTDTDGDGVGDACDCTLAPGPLCVNAAATHALVDAAGNLPDSTGLGAVTYEFQIANTEVTNAEYRDFLEAVAAEDPKRLYSEEMASDPRGGILRSGSPGSWLYRLKPNLANKPVNFVSWLDAARYANWLENGQPCLPGADPPPDPATCVTGPATTETGAFDLTVGGAGESAVIDPAASWTLPTEDEWVKAAYYDPFTDPSLPRYRLYPTGADTDPVPATAGVLGDVANPGDNVANHESGAAWNGVRGNLTTVDSAGSLSPFGTADQGGNVAEWLGSPAESASRLVRGGSAAADRVEMRSTFAPPGSGERDLVHRSPGYEGADVGFRVVMRLWEEVDTDGDGVPDSEDNCLDIANADQRDTDADGYGNRCDADLNDDGTTDFLDLSVMKSVFRTADPDADLNGDGTVDFLDLGILKSLFRRAPGPSGLACAGVSVPCP